MFGERRRIELSRFLNATVWSYSAPVMVTGWLRNRAKGTFFGGKARICDPQWEAGRVQPCSLEALPGCPMPNIDIDREEPCGVGRSLLPSQKPAALWVYALSKT